MNSGGVAELAGRVRWGARGFDPYVGLRFVHCSHPCWTAGDAKPMGSTTLVALEESVQSLFSLPSLDGPTHELARLRGRIVLVHFFATRCEPCRAEMASLRQLQSRLDGRPFVPLYSRVLCSLQSELPATLAVGSWVLRR